jgi:hypothetical protein
MRLRKLFTFLTMLGFGASLALGQNTQEPAKKKKLWPQIVEGTVDINMSRPNFDFPPEVYFSPMYRWGGQQVAAIVPPIPANWLNTLTLGVNVHPLPTRFLNNLTVGYAVNFHFGFQNSFRDGSFLSRAEYANGENAFTYARLSGFGKAQTFRAAYSGIPIWKSKDKDADTNGIYLEIGPKYTTYSNVEVTQGYDTFNEDVVYRKSLAKGRSLGGSLIVKLAHDMKDSRGHFAVRLGVEYEQGYLEFRDFPGHRPFSMLSLGFFGIELGF